MAETDLQIHVEMKDGAIARVSPHALNDPAFIDALNAMIAAVRLGGGGGVLVGEKPSPTEAKDNAELRERL